jgi:PAS domain S-box-containing protein
MKQTDANPFQLVDQDPAEAPPQALQSISCSLLDQLPVGFFHKDLQGRYLFVNEWFCRFKDTTLEEFIGKTADEFAAGKWTAEDAADPERRRQIKSLQEGANHHKTIVETGQSFVIEERTTGADGKEQYYHVIKGPLYGADGTIIGSQGLLLDITPIKDAEAKVEQMHRQLLETSRQAGMAEVATNVLHNVGNVLNSVNVSSTLLLDHAKRLSVANLGKAVGLLNEHNNDLASYVTNDPKGKQLPAYLNRIFEQLAKEQQRIIGEIQSLGENIEQIKEIVAMQQNYARVSGVAETVKVTDLVEDALRMNAGALAPGEVSVVRDFSPTAPIKVEKHKVLQILVNLISNARHACDESDRLDKQITLRIFKRDERTCISVIDNGVGIPPENRTRIFNHGFTTRKDGHGFGLHSGALAATEIGGRLTVQSDGIGSGATFTLELPPHPPKAA